MAKRQKQISHTAGGMGEVGLQIGWGITAFFLIMVSCFASYKIVSALWITATIAIILLCRKELRQRINIPFLFVCGFVAMGGISTIYAVSGKFALGEFIKLATGGCVFLWAFLFSKQGKSNRGCGALVVATAVLGLLSLDMISTGIFSGIFEVLMNLVAKGYTNGESMGIVERLAPMAISANVFSSCLGIGTILSLGLVMTEKEVALRRLYLCCLYFNALIFVLSLSLGATAMIAVAFVLYLLVEHSERRVGLFVLMVETLVTVVVGMVPIYVLGSAQSGGMNPLPLLIALVGAVLLCAADCFVGQRITQTLEGRGKLVSILIAVVLVASVGYGALAMNLTTGITLKAGDHITRSVDLTAGDYTLDVDGTGTGTLSIVSQTKDQILTVTREELYEGDAMTEISFTVPENTVVVHMTFATESGMEMASATVVGQSGETSVPLKYTILPEFAASRLQGLWANDSVLLRLALFKDGINLFKESPVIGLGMGAFESMGAGIQTSYFMTRYAHSHPIQVMLETGIIGLIFFVGIFATTFLVLYRARKKENCGGMVVTWIVALFYIIAHSSMEFTLSDAFYIMLAYAILGWICSEVGGELPLLGGEKLQQKVRSLTPYVVAVLYTVFLAFLGVNMYAYQMVTGGGEARFMTNLSTAVKIDKFEWADYMMTYMVKSIGTTDEAVKAQAEEYAIVLGQQKSNSSAYYLGMYYLSNGDIDNGYIALKKHITNTVSDSKSWNEAFELLLKYASTYMRDAAEGYVTELYTMMVEWNNNNLGHVMLLPDVERQLMEYYPALREIK